ncbi:DinB family protein [Bacillus massiliigorillae]|uniref:DinB family protein n=1 Tax=Bacillus massiliigorillae TaxID=1243664 RepID=UPI0003A933CF|nr:DinB family protein [Bacillus massiliigorillae]
MTLTKLKEDTAKVESVINQMVQIIETTDESLLYKKPSAEEWSVMQIASHVIEAVEFWVADLNALLIVPGAKWGRNHEHVRRLAAVEENYVTSISKEQAIVQLQALIPLTEQALQKVQEEDLVKTAPSYNPNFDGKPLSFLINHLIILHIEGHLGQMERHLAKVQ